MEDTIYDIKYEISNNILTYNMLKNILQKHDQILKMEEIRYDLKKIFFKNEIYYFNKEYHDKNIHLLYDIKNVMMSIQEKSKKLYLLIPMYAIYNIERQLIDNYKKVYKKDMKSTLVNYCFVCKSNNTAPEINCQCCTKSFHKKCINIYDDALKDNYHCPMHICSLCKKFSKSPKWKCNNENVAICFKAYCDTCSNYLKIEGKECSCIPNLTLEKEIFINNINKDSNLLEFYNIEKETILFVEPKYANYDVTPYFKKWLDLSKKDLSDYCYICKKGFNSDDINYNCFLDENIFFHKSCIVNYAENKHNKFCPKHICSECKTYTNVPTWSCNKCFNSFCNICFLDLSKKYKCPCKNINK